MKNLLLYALLLIAPTAFAQNPLFLEDSFNTQSAALPTFSIASPYSGNPATVTLADATGGAAILYCQDTTNTCTPSTSGTSVSFTSTGYIRASATASGVNPSAVASWHGTLVLTPAVLQVNASVTDGVYSTTLPSHAAGGLTCVLAGMATSTTPSISNTAGFTWSLAKADIVNDGGASLYAWCAPKTAYGSTDTITLGSGSYHGGLVVLDVSNVSVVDATASADGSSYSVPATGNFAVTGTVDMVLGLSRCAGGACAAGSGFTLVNVASEYLGAPYWIPEYWQIAGSPANVTVTGATSNWDTIGVALK